MVLASSIKVTRFFRASLRSLVVYRMILVIGHCGQNVCGCFEVGLPNVRHSDIISLTGKYPAQGQPRTGPCLVKLTISTESIYASSCIDVYWFKPCL